MDKKLIIIDGSSLLYRAFYALPLLSYNGIYTNAVYGFLRMLLKIYNSMNPTYIAVSFDKSRESFRNTIYKDYKATRKPAPDELVPQFTLIKEVLRVMGVAIYEPEGYEGDDVLGTLAEKYKDILSVCILTGDRDALQLVDDKVTVFLTQKGISNMSEMTPKLVKEKYGITPKQVIDMKSLMGDSSDNIPGVRGIGEKTALKLVAAYGDLEGIYKHIGDIKGAVRKKLDADKESAYLSHQLATIRRDIPLKSTLEEMRQPIHVEEMQSLFLRLGLQSLLLDFSNLSHFQELSKLKKEEVKRNTLSIKTFSEEADFQGKTVALTASFLGKTPFYKVESLVICSENEVWNVPKSCFNASIHALSFATHIVVEDSKKFWESDFPVEGLSLDDVTILAYLLEPGRIDYSLSYLASVCNIKPIYPEQLENSVEACAVKGRFILSAFDHLYDQLKKHKADNLYKQIEIPLVEVLASMEKIGIATDQKKWKLVLRDMQSREEILLQSIYKEAGETFNVNSPKQLGHILFEKMQLPAEKKTKTGYSTAAPVLEALADSYTFVKNILQYRTLSKLISTYLTALPQLIVNDTGRIHTSFNQTVTATGRLSSSDPNLQNIPVRTEEGRKIRSLFVPGEGYDCFISSDYSQVELRILAHMSGDPGLIAAFANKEDIHRRTAAEIMGVPFESVTAEQRSHAKAINFGIIYGISDYGLARQLGISRAAASSYMKNYFERYPYIHKYMESMIEEARHTGGAVTMFGRFRKLPDINNKNFNRRSFAERTAMNTPIQGTAADIMKIAMCKVYKKIKEKNYKSRLILQVHDELIVEAVNSEVEELKQLLKRTMEEVVALQVPLIADVHVGINWADTK